MATTRIRTHVNTQDITWQFRNAASSVPLGILIKENHFSMFEAVGAIEIGDPKMDSGRFADDEFAEVDFDVAQDLLPEELLWLMDRLMCTEVGWLMGHPLSQTLFTSRHIDKLLWPVPETLESATFHRDKPFTILPKSMQILRAFCLCLLKSCDVILLMITSQHFYEEEDFTTQLFNRELLRRLDHNKILDTVEALLEDLGEVSDNPVIQKALSTRLQFRYQVLEFVIHNSKGISCSTNDNTIKGFYQLLTNLRSTSDDLRRPVEAAFSTKLQRRLASTVPPRPMVAVGYDQAWQFWEQLVTDAANCFDVLTTTKAEDMLRAYTILAFDTTELSAYPRSLLQSFLELGNKVAGRFTDMQFLEEDLRILTMPATGLFFQSPRKDVPQEAVRKVAEVSAKFAETFINLYRALCLNRCRSRRTFCHAITEWDRLQLEVEEVDATIQDLTRESPIPYPPGSDPTHAFALSSWIYHYKLKVVRLTVQMGFQQRIYAPEEHATMYWYLSSICDAHLGHLERISYFVSHREAAITHGSDINASKSSSLIAECKDALQRLYREFVLVKAIQSLSTALHAVFLILHRRRAISRPHPTYSSDTLRCEIRMRPFMHMAVPECPSFEDLETYTAMGSSSDTVILDNAATAAIAAKRGWEELLRTDWNRHKLERPGSFLSREAYDAAVPGQVIQQKWQNDLRSTIKATIATSLLILRLKKEFSTEQRGESSPVKAELPVEGQPDHWHRWWIVPRIK